MKKTFIAALLAMLPLLLSAQPKVVGHRGARHNTPENPAVPYYENTIEALKFAQSLGIYGAEFDIQLTADEKIIVFHGPIVPGLNKSIHDMTYAEARKVVLPGGHRMPTLKEWFKQAKKDPSTHIILEIKKQSTPERETAAVEQCMALAKKMKMGTQLEYTTFSDWCCQEIHRVDPSAKVLFLASGKDVPDADFCASRGYDAMSYDVVGWQAHPEYIKRAKELGMETTLWLANDKATLDWATQHEVDFVSSDHPENAAKGFVK